LKVMSAREQFPGTGFAPKRVPRRMCESCVEIDKQIAQHQKRLKASTDQVEMQRISRLIAQLYADRVRKHQNPEK
jgi:hypothetical protein